MVSKDLARTAIIKGIQKALDQTDLEKLRKGP